LKKPLCYGTYVTEGTDGEPLERCSNCKLAYYVSREEQRKHWRVHKLVCKPPNFEAFANLNAAQCNAILREKNIPFDQDISPILCRLYKVYFDTGYRTKTNQESLEDHHQEIELHAMARPGTVDDDEDAGSSIGGFDSMKKKFDIAWQVPGLPQLLLLSNFSGELFMKHKQEHPEGYSRPWEVAGIAEKARKEIMLSMMCKEFRLINQSSSQKIGWFIVGFLVRSVVYGTMKSECLCDGIGTLRETGYSTAAKYRAIELFLSREVRLNFGWALWPVPSLIFNLVTNGHRSELVHWQEKLIKSGVLFALMDYALMQNYNDPLEFIGKTLTFLSKQKLSMLDWDAKLDTFAMAITVALHKFVDFQGVIQGRDQQEDGPFKVLEMACLDIADNILANCGDKSMFVGQLKIKKQWNIDMWPRQHLKYDVRAFMGFQVEVKLPGHVERKVRAWKKMEMRQKKRYVTMSKLEMNGWIAEANYKKDYRLLSKAVAYKDA